jgi:hypothetical protein
MYITETQLERMEELISQNRKRKEKFKKDLDITIFYSLAKKYGFCNPYCECGLCEK